MNNNKIIIVWFRQDLRITDNPALFAASQEGQVMPIYILEKNIPEEFNMGSASKWWLNYSLIDLNNSLDNNLNVYMGDSIKIINNIIKNNNIAAVYWNRCYEPWRINIDANIKQQLTSKNIIVKSFNGSLLWEPWEIFNNNKEPYKIYTHFYRKAKMQPILPRKPFASPKKLILIKDFSNKININSLGLISNIKWYKKFKSCWQVGEKVAFKKLIKFIANNLEGYKENRNYPDKSGTSKLSMHLHFGEISPNQIWYSINNNKNIKSEDIDCFLSEIGWREFSYYLLYHFKDLSHKNFQTKFNYFAWEYSPKLLEAWQQGKTGYPIIDAGMRELWHTGYMHNRIRMIVGSFLVKNLLIDWRHGASWFFDCLLDADLANNSASWQWVAGSGADAVPYFRIFNPITQGEKFDKEGNYTRRFVPELINLPNKYLFKPWEAPDNILKAANIVLGVNYPKPIINLEASRAKALDAYKLIKKL
jgi:deoxyribodipyrimidine photo-lyase